mgnify:CR=1 FL=1
MVQLQKRKKTSYFPVLIKFKLKARFNRAFKTLIFISCFCQVNLYAQDTTYFRKVFNEALDLNQPDLNEGGKLYNGLNAPVTFGQFFSFGMGKYTTQFNSQHVANGFTYMRVNGDGGLGAWQRLYDSGHIQELKNDLNLEALSLYNGWVNYPGYDANTIAVNKVGFTYANNAPHNGSLWHLGPTRYSLQVNASYGNEGLISFRTFNGDNNTWGNWRRLVTNDELLYNGWVNYPGQDANTLAINKVNFTYANNAPFNGPILHFGPQNYSMQFNSEYGGNQLAFRTHNGDVSAWRPWKRLLTEDDINAGGENFQSVTNRGNTTTPGKEINFRSVDANRYVFLGGVTGYPRIGAYNLLTGYDDLIFDCKNIGIGTTSPGEKLTVNGKIHAKEVKVDLNVPAPDYVFEEHYKLPRLKDIKNYITQYKHLPEVPSAREMKKNGIDLSEMNMLLLKKVEELTLHLIEKEQKIDHQDTALKEVLKRIDQQQQEIDKLKAKNP